MKFMKYLFVLAFATAFFATASVSHAQGTPVYVASGSSALFLEMGQAAASLGTTGCYWTHKTDTSSPVAARDPRTTPATDENGNIWIAWGRGSGTCGAPLGSFVIYSQMSLDSVLGDRCFFIAPTSSTTGCTQIIGVAAGAAGNPGGTSLLGAAYTDTALPGNVISALNNSQMNVAATDIRPEDAKFATQRMFAACGAAFVRNPYIQTSYQTYGLGYSSGGSPNIGVSIQSYTNPGVVFHVLNFNITGGDPITGDNVPSYQVLTVGAQPIVVAVAPFNSTTVTNEHDFAFANDVMFSTLSEYFIGNYGRVDDLTSSAPGYVPPATEDNTTTVALVREPLSGTYNTFEYSVPNSNEFKTSQDVNNCSGSVVGTGSPYNPMHQYSANGYVNSFRNRAIGTGEVTAALQAATSQNTIGYFFWSAANAAGLSNVKYLTVNGVDPLQNSYIDGTLPGNTDPLTSTVVPVTNVNFKNLNQGDYPIWSALRLVANPTSAAYAQGLITAAQTLPATANDFIPLSNLHIWKSHYNMFGIGITNNANGNTVYSTGDLCSQSGAPGEGGGDAGAMVISIHGNNDFCNDFATGIGINDKNN